MSRRSGGAGGGGGGVVPRVGGSCPRGGGSGVPVAVRNQLALSSETSSPTRIDGASSPSLGVNIGDATTTSTSGLGRTTSTSTSSSTACLKDDLKITASQKELMTSTVDSGVESLAAAGKQLQDSFGDEEMQNDGMTTTMMHYRHNSNSSIPTSSPLPPSTGLDQVMTDFEQQEQQ